MDANESKLVFKAQYGDRTAFDQLLRIYERDLFRHIYRMLQDEDASYDLLQETYLVVVRSIRNLRHRESFRPWIYGVATRTCIKAINRRTRRSDAFEIFSEPKDSQPLPDSSASVREEIVALIDRIVHLSPGLRSVVLLHFVEELTLKDTAAALELSIGTVKSRLSAALGQLRHGQQRKGVTI